MRICAYRKCDVCIDEMRPNALYCCPEHKSRENHLLRAEGRGSGRAAGKPDKSGQNRRRRPNRDGVGTHLYLLPEDLRFVRELLDDPRPRYGPDRRRFEDLVRKAQNRIARRSAG